MRGASKPLLRIPPQLLHMHGRPEPPPLLLVEDYPLLAACAADYLSRRGLSVETANDTVSALRALASRSWDVVVTDLDLTGTGTADGMDVVAAAARAEPRPAILVWSGGADAETRAAALLLGADAVLEKGRLSDLADRVASLLAKPEAAVVLAG